MIISSSISSHCTDKLVESGLIDISDREAYSFCFEFVFNAVFFIISIVIFGIILGQFKNTLIFLLVFYPLRKIGGGAHFNSARICSFFSYLISFVIITLPWQSIVNGVPCYTIYVFACFIILFLTPIDHPNLRYSSKQKKRLKRWMIVDILTISVILELSVYYGDAKITGMIVACMVITMLNQLLGIIFDRSGYYEA